MGAMTSGGDSVGEILDFAAAGRPIAGPVVSGDLHLVTKHAKGIDDALVLAARYFGGP
jgi:hypothetical protein